MQKNKLYTLKEASELLNISEQTLRRWDENGKIHCDRTIGGHRRISIEEIEKMKKFRKIEKEFFCRSCHNRIDKNNVKDGWYDLLYPYSICPDCYTNIEVEKIDNKIKNIDENKIEKNILEYEKYHLYQKCDNCRSDYAYPWEICSKCHAPNHFEMATLWYSNYNNIYMDNRKEMDDQNCNKCKYRDERRHCNKFKFDITNLVLHSFGGESDGNPIYNSRSSIESITVCKGFEKKINA